MVGLRFIGTLFGKANSFFNAFDIRQGPFVFTMARPAARDEKDTKKSQKTATDKFDGLLTARPLKVAI